jgi:hypothetical protein
VGGNGVAPYVDAPRDGLLGAHRRRVVLAAHGLRPTRCGAGSRGGRRESNRPVSWKAGRRRWWWGDRRNRRGDVGVRGMDLGRRRGAEASEPTGPAGELFFAPRPLGFP